MTTVRPETDAPVTGECPRCLRATVAHSQWRAAAPEDRRRWTSHRVAPRNGRGLCAGCYKWAMQMGCLDRYDTVQVPLEVVLDEWHHMADPMLPVAQEIRRLAPRLGMSEKTLESALLRGGVRSRYAGGWGERMKVA